MFLENESLKLRALEPADLELLYEWENNTEIWGISNTLAPYSKYVLYQYIENSHRDLLESKQLRLIIELKLPSGNEAIGTVDLFEIDFYNKRAGIGILIADTRHRKKGYANLTVQLLEDYVVKQLDLNQLYCHIDMDNKASLNLFKNAGYELIGILKNWKKNFDGWKDVYFLQHLL